MKVKSTKSALLMSFTSLLLCFAMLIGCTFAWFTDSVTSGVNKIVAGNLDVELYHQSKNVAQTKVTEATENLFKDVALWEPGAYSYETFTVKNEGDLALKYKMALNVASFTSYEGHNLTEVIKVATAETAPATREAAAALTGYTALKDWSYTGGASDTTLGKGESKTFTVVLYWEPTANDNAYNMNNGRPQPLSVDLGVTLVATQVEAESDSFGTDYDAGTVNTLPEATKYESKLAEAKSVETAISTTEVTHLSADATPTTSSETGRQTTTVSFPAGALTTEGNQKAVLSVKTTNSLFNVTNAGAQVASIDLSVLVNGQPVTNFGGNKVTVETYISAGLNNVSVSYNGTGAAPTDITYDSNTGRLTFQTTHFSEYDVSGAAIAYILGDKDTGFAPAYNTEDAIKDAYEAAATAALETGAQVELTKDADMKKAAKAAEEKGASFVIPTQVVQEIEKTGKTDEKVQSNFEARIGTQYYATLGGAIEAAQSGATITLLKDCAGNGIKVPSEKNFTIDFNGFTYNIDGTTVGSTGTETNGFQLLKDSTITFKNGKLTSNKAKILIQNYCNLTLENMVLDGTKLVGGGKYAASNNNGTVMIKNTTINAASDGVAFDVYSFGSYSGANVTVQNSVINGKVEVGVGKKNKPNQDENADTTKLGLNIESGTINGNIKVDNIAANKAGVVSITGGTVCASSADELKALIGYVANDAQNVTIKLTDNIDVTSGITVNKNITLDTNGKTVTNVNANTGTRALSVNSGATLTVTGNGKFIAGEGSYCGDNSFLIINEGGTLVVNSGYFEGANNCIGTIDKGKTTINNAEVKALAGSACLWVFNGGVLDVYGLTFYGIENDTEGCGCVWAGYTSANCTMGGGTANIYGGTYRSYPMHKEELKPGEINGSNYCLYDYYDATSYGYTPGTINVYGGTFIGFDPSGIGNTPDTSNANHPYLSEGYVATKNGNTWIVEAN